jgi:hypothetical protein
MYQIVNQGYTGSQGIWYGNYAAGMYGNQPKIPSIPQPGFLGNLALGAMAPIIIVGVIFLLIVAKR